MKLLPSRFGGPRSRRGTVLLISLIMAMVMAGMVAAYVTLTRASNRALVETKEETALIFAADAALSQALFLVRMGAEPVIGAPGAPVEIAGAQCTVESVELDGNFHALLATASNGHLRRRIEMLVQITPNTHGFSHSLFGRRGVNLASNVRIDSFDSALGTYAQQVGVSGHAASNASITSNDNVTVSSNCEIWGAIQHGPDSGDTATIAGNSSISDGWAGLDEPVELRPIRLPGIASTGDLVVNQKKLTIGPGRLGYDAMTVNKRCQLTIKGPAVIEMTSFLLQGGGDWIIDATDGPVDIFVKDSFVLSSNSTCSTSSPSASQVRINLLADHDSIDDVTPLVQINSNANFIGALYAPEASLIIDSNFQIYGAVAAEWITMASNTLFHYDEALGRVLIEEGGTPEMISWRPLTLQQERDWRTRYAAELAAASGG